MKKNILFGTPTFPDWTTSIQKIDNAYIKEFRCKKKMHNFIIENNISLIIPTTYEQMKFVINNGIDNTQLLCCKNYESIDILNNKCKFIKFINDNNLIDFIPKVKLIKYDDYTIENGNVPFPVIFKYVIACGGFGSKICYTKYELNNTLDKKTNYIVQEYIKGQTEMSGHMFIKDGIIKHVIYYSTTHNNEHYIQHGKMSEYKRILNFDLEKEKVFGDIFKLLDYTGFACIDFKIINNNVKIFEINPRLGGTLVNNEKDLREMLDIVLSCY